jgi:hypothetical protein
VLQETRRTGNQSSSLRGCLAFPPTTSKRSEPAVDKALARRRAQLQALPRRDRDALLLTLDAFLAQSGKVG